MGRTDRVKRVARGDVGGGVEQKGGGSDEGYKTVGGEERTVRTAGAEHDVSATMVKSNRACDSATCRVLPACTAAAAQRPQTRGSLTGPGRTGLPAHTRPQEAIQWRSQQRATMARCPL